uniref:Uncharacterized protein n=1 Tax=Acrobeloides nanus TaxID=290746 RepID=A0A914DDV2_9BILA
MVSQFSRDIEKYPKPSFPEIPISEFDNGYKLKAEIKGKQRAIVQQKLGNGKRIIISASGNSEVGQENFHNWIDKIADSKFGSWSDYKDTRTRI